MPTRFTIMAGAAAILLTSLTATAPASATPLGSLGVLTGPTVGVELVHGGRHYRRHHRRWRPHPRHHRRWRGNVRVFHHGCETRVVRFTPYGRVVKIFNRCRRGYRGHW